MKKALAATLTLAALFAFASCSKEPTKINVNDYFKYDLSGITGQGVVTYSIDAEGLLEDNEEALDGCTEKKITNALQGAWDKEAEIANGDEIKFKWDLDTDVIEKKYNVIFEAEDVKVTVDNLEKLPEFNPFDYLSITFTGTAPDGMMTVDDTLSKAPVSGLRFNYDKDSKFKNGDVVKVTVTAGSNDLTEYCKEKGYTIVADTKEFKVEGLDEYVTTKADLTDDMIKELSKQAEDKYYSSIGNWEEEATLDSVEYFGYYFVTLKDGVESGYGHYNNNYLYIILQPKATNPNETFTYFYYVRFQDIVKKADGTNEIYDIYATAVPEGSYFFGLSGEAFLSEGGEDGDDYCYEGYRSTADLYNAVLRPMSEYYIVDKSFDADVEGTSTAPATPDTEATEATEEGETTEETEATEETEETEAEETEETEATEEAA